MKKSHAKSFSVDKESIIRWLRTVGIFLAPSLLIFFTELQQGNMDSTIFAPALIASTIDAVRRFVNDYSNYEDNKHDQ